MCRPAAARSLAVPAAGAAQKLDERIVKGQDLYQREVRSIEELNKLDEDYDKWNAYNKDLLARLFTTDRLAKEYALARNRS
jgi:hypothetical protein